MKKVLTIISISAGLAVSTQAQGLVNFNNTSSAVTKISVNSVIGGSATALATLAVASPTYYYALFSSVSATTVNGSGSGAVIPTAPGVTGSYAFSDPNWTFDGYAQSGTTRAGQVTGSATQVVPNIAGASTGQLVVLGWSANIGSTVASVQSFFAGTDNGVSSGFVGESSVTGTLTMGNGGGVSAPSPFGTAAPFAPGFVLGTYQVPEPTSIALAVMGGVSLLALRRKKA